MSWTCIISQDSFIWIGHILHSFEVDVTIILCYSDMINTYKNRIYCIICYRRMLLNWRAPLCCHIFIDYFLHNWVRNLLDICTLFSFHVACPSNCLTCDTTGGCAGTCVAFTAFQDPDGVNCLCMYISTNWICLL